MRYYKKVVRDIYGRISGVFRYDNRCAEDVREKGENNNC